MFDPPPPKMAKKHVGEKKGLKEDEKRGDMHKKAKIFPLRAPPHYNKFHSGNKSKSRRAGGGLLKPL